MPVQEKSAESLHQLIEAVVSIGDGLQAGRQLWFRGMACHACDLLPAIMRDGKTGAQVMERERRLITRFRQRSVAYWPRESPRSDWELFFAMQHYGIPTRLLDWSENLLVATYFASGKKPHTLNCECKPVVWCVDPIEWNRQTPLLSEYGDSVNVLTTGDDDIDGYQPLTKKKVPRTPVAMYGTHNSDRIVAQRGTFFVWGAETNPLQAIEVNDRTLWRVTLTMEHDKLAEQLGRIGLTETMVYPELASLGTELSASEGWRHE